AQRLTFRPDRRAAPAHVRIRGRAPPQAPHAGRGGGAGRARLLSSLSARPARRRGSCMAERTWNAGLATVFAVRTKRAMTVVGCHAGGEIGNVVVGGLTPPPGATVFEQMQALA